MHLSIFRPTTHDFHGFQLFGDRKIFIDHLILLIEIEFVFEEVVEHGCEVVWIYNSTGCW